MMLGINLSGLLIATAGLVMSNDIRATIEFLRANPRAIKFLAGTGWESSLGQYIAFYIIGAFGPVALAILMTTRQVLSIVISTVLFNHHIVDGWIVGIIALSTVAFQIKKNYFMARQSDALIATWSERRCASRMIILRGMEQPRNLQRRQASAVDQLPVHEVN